MVDVIEVQNPDSGAEVRPVGDDSAFLYNMVAGDASVRRPRCEAFSTSSLLTRLALLSSSGMLGDELQSLTTLRDELVRTIAAEDAPREWRDQLSELRASLDGRIAELARA